eukprot:g2507.t1
MGNKVSQKSSLVFSGTVPGCYGKIVACYYIPVRGLDSTSPRSIQYDVVVVSNLAVEHYNGKSGDRRTLFKVHQVPGHNHLNMIMCSTLNRKAERFDGSSGPVVYLGTNCGEVLSYDCNLNKLNFVRHSHPDGHAITAIYSPGCIQKKLLVGYQTGSFAAIYSHEGDDYMRYEKVKSAKNDGEKSKSKEEADDIDGPSESHVLSFAFDKQGEILFVGYEDGKISAFDASHLMPQSGAVDRTWMNVEKGKESSSKDNKTSEGSDTANTKKFLHLRTLKGSPYPNTMAMLTTQCLFVLHDQCGDTTYGGDNEGTLWNCKSWTSVSLPFDAELQKKIPNAKPLLLTSSYISFQENGRKIFFTGHSDGSFCLRSFQCNKSGELVSSKLEKYAHATDKEFGKKKAICAMYFDSRVNTLVTGNVGGVCRLVKKIDNRKQLSVASKTKASSEKNNNGQKTATTSDKTPEANDNEEEKANTNQQDEDDGDESFMQDEGDLAVSSPIKDS